MLKKIGVLVGVLVVTICFGTNLFGARPQPKKSNGQLLLDFIKMDLETLYPDADDAKINEILVGKMARSNVILRDLSVVSKDGNFIADCLNKIQALQGKPYSLSPSSNYSVMQCLDKITEGDFEKDVMNTARFIVLEDAFKATVFGVDDITKIGNRPISPEFIKYFNDQVINKKQPKKPDMGYNDPTKKDPQKDPTNPIGGGNPGDDSPGEGGYTPSGGGDANCDKASKCAQDNGLIGDGEGGVKMPGNMSVGKGDPLKDWIDPTQHADNYGIDLGTLPHGGYDLGGCFGLNMAQAGMGAGKPKGQPLDPSRDWSVKIVQKFGRLDPADYKITEISGKGDGKMDNNGTVQGASVTTTSYYYDGEYGTKSGKTSSTKKVSLAKEGTYGHDKLGVDSPEDLAKKEADKLKQEADKKQNQVGPSNPPKVMPKQGGYGDPSGDSSSPCSSSPKFTNKLPKGLINGGGKDGAALLGLACTESCEGNGCLAKAGDPNHIGPVDPKPSTMLGSDITENVGGNSGPQSAVFCGVSSGVGLKPIQGFWVTDPSPQMKQNALKFFQKK